MTVTGAGFWASIQHPFFMLQRQFERPMQSSRAAAAAVFSNGINIA
jgi:hypothetical protein